MVYREDTIKSLCYLIYAKEVQNIEFFPFTDDNLDSYDVLRKIHNKKSNRNLQIVNKNKLKTKKLKKKNWKNYQINYSIHLHFRSLKIYLCPMRLYIIHLMQLCLIHKNLLLTLIISSSADASISFIQLFSRRFYIFYLRYPKDIMSAYRKLDTFNVSFMFRLILIFNHFRQSF